MTLALVPVTGLVVGPWWQVRALASDQTNVTSASLSRRETLVKEATKSEYKLPHFLGYRRFRRTVFAIDAGVLGVLQTNTDTYVGVRR